MTGIMNLETMTLGDIVESLSWQNPNIPRTEKIENARKIIFNFNYPYWTEEHKQRFETLFIRKFYETEIGFQTEGRFFFELENWLLENMEYYVKLLKSQLWEEQIKNPLSNYDMTESATDKLTKSGTEKTTVSQEETRNNNIQENSNVSRETSAENSGTSFDRNIETDTPQNRLSITTEDGTGVIEYASRIAENKSTSSANQTSLDEQTGSNTSTANGTANTDSEGNVIRSESETNEHNLTRVGNIGVMTYDQLLNGYRSIFMRIEKQMLDEMRTELFMLVY